MNVLYIHTHDTGRFVSPYGFDVETPNYQRFCDDSLLFENAHSVAPTCSPSRACLLTGVYPHQNGMLGLAQRGFKLRREMHLAHILHELGWQTVLCGVQHEIGYYTEHERAAGVLGYELDLSRDARPYKEKDLVLWDRENAHALAAWLESRTDERPFFASFGMHATHRAYPDETDSRRVNRSRPPLNVPSNEVTRQDFADFKKSARMADDCLGFVLDALERVGLYEQTIIILTTDHGIAYPFAKGTLRDAGTGVLLAMRAPGASGAKGVYDGLVSHLDVMPTLFELLDIDRPEYLEGRSFARLFAGESIAGDQEVFGEMNFHTSYEPARSVRTERFLYIRNFDSEYRGINFSNIDDSPVKEFYREHGLQDMYKGEEYLFDLAFDPGEVNNLAGDGRYGDVLEDMRSRMERFMRQTDDPLLDGPIPIDPAWKVNVPTCYSAHSKVSDDYVSIGAGCQNAAVNRG